MQGTGSRSATCLRWWRASSGRRWSGACSGASSLAPSRRGRAGRRRSSSSPSSPRSPRRSSSAASRRAARGAPPYRLPTAAISSVYLVYAAGVVSSPVAGRLSGRVAPRTLIAVGLAVEAAGMLLTTARPLPLVVLGLVVLVVGTFTAQAVTPAFVNVTAQTAKGGASALYLTSYYVGGTLGSAIPGLAFQAAGWPAVVACCAGAVGLALLANALLCGRVPRRSAIG